MTESVSGFLFPEERAALEKRRGSEPDAQFIEVWRLVIRALSEHGPTPLAELIERVGERPRFVMSAVDQMEQAGVLEVVARGVQEVAELTAAGRREAESL